MMKRAFVSILSIAALCHAQFKSRDELPQGKAAEPAGPFLIVPAGTRLPIQLRQPLSTKNAQPGDAVYAQTSFPIAVPGGMAIPAGTWVQGVVDTVKRAGRIKGKAELQFHLTTLIFANGQTVDMAAAIEQVPGAKNSSVKEPGVVQQDSEKGRDFEKALDTGAKMGGIGTMVGMASMSTPTARGIRTIGAAGLAGVAAGTLMAILMRGSDVQFDTGTSIEISLTEAIAIEKEKLK